MRRRDPVHHSLQRLTYTLPALTGGKDRVLGRHGEGLFDLLANPLGLGRRQIYLVDQRDYLQVCIHRKLRVGDRLRLDALRSVDDEHSALTRL